MIEIRRPGILIPSLFFLVPVNIYILGDWNGAGLQWALFRYQRTAGGESLVSSTRDLTSVITGMVSGMNGLAISLWSLAVFLLLLYFVLTLWAVVTENLTIVQKSSLILVICGLLFLLSDMVQFG